MRPRGGLWESTVAEGWPAGPGHRQAAAAPGGPAAAADHLTFCAPAGSPPARAARRCGYLPSPAGIPLVANPRTAGIGPDPTRLDAWALSLGDLEVF